MPANVQLARQQWEEGHRQFRELAREPRRAEQLHALVDLLTERLRRRVGSTFTLQELADSYQTAERWAHDTLAEQAERPGWPSMVVTALDAAFHLYARGARDYAP